jgi:hypothetical protein
MCRNTTRTIPGVIQTLLHLDEFTVKEVFGKSDVKRGVRDKWMSDVNSRRRVCNVGAPWRGTQHNPARNNPYISSML